MDYVLVANQMFLDVVKYHIRKICEKLKVGEDVAKKAIEIAKSYVNNHGIPAFKDTKSLACVCIYVASKDCGKWVKQKEIAEVAGITEQTIRNWLKKIPKKSSMERIIEVLKEHDFLTSKEIAEKLGLSYSTTMIYLRKLRRGGVISSKKVGKSLVWFLLKR